MHPRFPSLLRIPVISIPNPHHPVLNASTLSFHLSLPPSAFETCIRLCDTACDSSTLARVSQLQAQRRVNKLHMLSKMHL